MARALETQCVTVMSSVVGAAEWSPAVDISVGAGGIYGPPDKGFPDTGVLAVGELNQPGWTYAEVNLQTIAHARVDGVVLNRRNWTQQKGRSDTAIVTNLRE
jgi:predicted amidohydrolase